MRLFIAVTLPQEIKDYLETRQEAMKKYCFKGNFSRPENLHLTVKFLGEVEPDRVIAVQNAMDEAAGTARSFKLKLGRWGHFSRGEKKILWVGLQGQVERLEQIFKKTDEALAGKGFPRENRKLKAHITLAREAVLKKDWETFKAGLGVEPKVVPVEGITLMESTRVNGVLTYVPLYYSAFREQAELGAHGKRTC